MYLIEPSSEPALSLQGNIARKSEMTIPEAGIVLQKTSIKHMQPTFGDGETQLAIQVPR